MYGTFSCIRVNFSEKEFFQRRVFQRICLEALRAWVDDLFSRLLFANRKSSIKFGVWAHSQLVKELTKPSKAHQLTTLFFEKINSISRNLYLREYLGDYSKWGVWTRGISRNEQGTRRDSQEVILKEPVRLNPKKSKI